jgi:hypothetical protein
VNHATSGDHPPTDGERIVRENPNVTSERGYMIAPALIEFEIRPRRRNCDAWGHITASASLPAALPQTEPRATDCDAWGHPRSRTTPLPASRSRR